MAVRAGGSAQVTESEGTRAPAPRAPLRRWLSSSAFWVLIVDIVLILVFGALSEQHSFLTWENERALALNATEALLLALGLGMVMGAGTFDLSLGANLVLSSVVGAKVIAAVSGVSPDGIGTPQHVLVAILAGLLACLIVGALFGLVNGLVIEYVKVNSLIATLGTLGVGSGIALLITGGSDVAGMPEQMQSDFALRSIANIPLPAFVALLLAFGLWALLRFFRYGRRTLAIGSSRTAAERSGIRVRRHVVSLTILCGAFAGFAGFVDLAHFSATTVQGHANDALAAITAVVIGGTLLEGGRVNVWGTVAGTALTVILAGGLVAIGVKPFWQLIAVGVVLIVAVAIDRFRRERDEA